MTTYRTGNPVGSSDPRDLYDNAENLDSLVNGDQAAYSDRLGESRKSWQAMEDEFAAFITSSGYEFVGDYAPGIELTGYQQILRDTSGEFWRLSGSVTLPYTTTGAGLPEGGAFVAVGDAVLRQELNGPLSSGQGAALVNGATIYVGSVAELEALSLPVGTAVYLTQEGRAGEFVVKVGTPPSDPQKGVYIALVNGNYAERVVSGEVIPQFFGAVADGVTDDHQSIQAAIDFCENPYVYHLFSEQAGSRTLFFPRGVYRISGSLSISNSGMSIKGEGSSSAIIHYDGSTLTTDDYILNVSSRKTSKVKISGISVRTGNISSLGETSPRGIRLKDTYEWSISDVTVYGCRQGLYAVDSWLGALRDSKFSYNYEGIYLNKQCHSVKLERVVFGRTATGYQGDSPSYHLKIRSCWGVSIKTCDFEHGVETLLDSCIYAENDVRALTIYDSYFERNSGYALYIRDFPSADDTNCKGIVFSGNLVNHPSGKGVLIRSQGAEFGYKLHSAISMFSNFFDIDPSEPYAVSLVPSGIQVCDNSGFFNNNIVSGNSSFNPSTYSINTDVVGVNLETESSKIFLSPEGSMSVWRKLSETEVSSISDSAGGTYISYPKVFKAGYDVIPLGPALTSGNVTNPTAFDAIDNILITAATTTKWNLRRRPGTSSVSEELWIGATGRWK